MRELADFVLERGAGGESRLPPHTLALAVPSDTRACDG